MKVNLKKGVDLFRSSVVNKLSDRAVHCHQQCVRCLSCDSTHSLRFRNPIYSLAVRVVLSTKILNLVTLGLSSYAAIRSPSISMIITATGNFIPSVSDFFNDLDRGEALE